MRRYIVIIVLLLSGAVVAASFYQPPMRLMPAPAIFLDNDGNTFTANPSLLADPEIKLFYATNRLPIGPAANRIYTIAPGRDLHMGEATVRIGDDATALDRIYEWSTRASNDTRPFLHLKNMNEQVTLETGAAIPPEAIEWLEQINSALEESQSKDIIIYVHGANTTVERAAGQAAQLRHFTGRNSVVLLFVWPTAENFLRYPRDMVTAFGAAPHLANLISLLSENTNAENIDVFTYSAGATVGSDALALIGRDARKPGAPKPRLGEVYHAAPDADFRSFVNNMRNYADYARRTTVSANLSDSALRLSQLVNRASRAGRPDMRELNDDETRWLLDATRDYRLELLRVRPENIPGLSRRSHAFWYDDPWVSSDVLITLLYHLRPDERGLADNLATSGAHYWTFMPDYLERLSAVLAKLRKRASNQQDDQS
ncbi:MAG: alpha/beta hydrolase [Phyllobacterium sp.]